MSRANVKPIWRTHLCRRQYLASVDDVNQPVALLLNNTVADTRKVGGIVCKS